jgi:hypothetical protein
MQRSKILVRVPLVRHNHGAFSSIILGEVRWGALTASVWKLSTKLVIF